VFRHGERPIVRQGLSQCDARHGTIERRSIKRMRLGK
jgi:hypothetical protein